MKCEHDVRLWSARGPLEMGIIAVLAVLAGIGAVQAQNPAGRVPGCGSLETAYGPWDYRKDRGEPLRLVESAHFTTEVETLIRGKSTTIVGGDIDYTLMAFPNHHRALLSAARLAERQKKSQPAGMRYTVECWFQRAVHWRPDDHVARMLFANWLASAGRRDEAMAQLKKVDATAENDNAITRYNLGLIYFDLKEYELALVQAHKAASLGYARSELRERLAAVGRWTDPPGGASAASASTPSTPASAASQ